MTVPYWVQDAIFYQIFPDRFYNGDPNNNPENIEPWGSKPTLNGFQGGDLRGIINKIDYLLSLGVNALYLNPIFLSPSNHRYNIMDYYSIDPRLGNFRDFQALIEVAHSNNIRIILDGVFNHCSRGFFAFVDLLENQEHSAFRNWFHVDKFPVDAYSSDKSQNYQAWWGFASLPKFNTSNPAVRQYIFDVARFWIEQGADGWRLDVPNEIDDDSFWAEFRKVVKTANPDAYICGEIWTADPRWVGNEHFDGLMNYPVRDALLEFLVSGTISASGFADKIEKIMALYPRENTYAMYLPLGSHDTERIFTLLKEDVDKLKLAYAFQFSLPGTPAIYYGDEIGLTGGKDPDCRKAFPWDSTQWHSDLRSWVKMLVSQRKRFSSMRRGDYKRIMVDDRRKCFAFSRVLNDQNVLVAMNASQTQRYLHLPVNELGWPDGRILHNLLGTDEYIVEGENVTINLPPWKVAWIN